MTPPKLTPDSPVWTVGQLAAFLKVHPSTIYRLLHKRAIPGFRIGSDWRFNREEIEKWLLAQQAHAARTVRR